MRLNHRLDRQAIAQRTAAGALFCAAAFALLPNGFAWFGALLIACTALLPDGFSRAWCSHRLGLRPVLWLSLAVVVLAVTSMRLTGQNWSVVDNYARFLLLPWSALMVCALAPARQWLWLGALTGVAIAFALAVCELATGAVRVEAGHNSIVFANAVLMLLVIVVYCRPAGRRPQIFIALAAALAMGLVAIVLSGTRGTLPGFGLMLLVAVLGGIQGNKRWWWTGCLFVAMACLLVLMWKTPWLASQARLDGIQADLQHYAQGNVDSPIGARLQFLELAWHAFVEHPWAGVGLNRFAAEIQSLPQCVQDLGVCRLGHAHNDLAQWAATLGIPGVLVIIAIYLVPLLQFLKLLRRNADKSASGAAWAGLMLVLVFLLSGMTQSMFSHALSTMTYVVFVGLLLGLALRESTGRTPGLT